MRTYLALLFLTGCYTPPDFAPTDLSAGIDTGGWADVPSAPDIVAFANAWQVSTLDELDHGCGLRSDSARAIDAHRAGPNGHPGDADDRLFHSEQDLLGVHMVGPVTLDQLEDCALDWGF